MRRVQLFELEDFDWVPDGEPVWHWELSGIDELTVRDALRKEALVLLHAGAREVIVPDPRGTRTRDVRELAKIDTVDLRPGSYAIHRCSPPPSR